MENIKRTGCAIVLAGLLLAICGCTESHAQKRAAMEAKWQSDTAEAKLAMINDMLDRGDVDQAKTTIQQSFDEDETHPQYHLLMGRIHFIEDNRQEAHQSFQTAVELDEQLAAGWDYLGSLAVLEKDYPQAIECYEKARMFEPTNAGYVIRLADVLSETGRNVQADQLLSEILDRYPQNLELMLALAQIKQRAGHFDEAITVYEQAQLLHGDLPEIVSACGYSYLAKGQWSQAARKFEKLLNHYKNEDKARYFATLRSIAVCSFNSGNYGRAMDCYDELSVEHRNDPVIWLSMAQCALGADQADKAIYYARKALKLQPHFPRAHAVLGSSYYLKGDYEKSLDSYRHITSDDNLGGFAWFMSGRCWQQLGDTEQASAAYQRAEKLDPDSELMNLFLKQTVQSL